MTFAFMTKSSTDNPIGPATDIKCPGTTNLCLRAVTKPLLVKRYDDGLRPYTPQKAAGNLTLPPTSVPIPHGIHLAATNPASPPLEPPQDLS